MPAPVARAKEIWESIKEHNLVKSTAKPVASTSGDTSEHGAMSELSPHDNRLQSNDVGSSASSRPDPFAEDSDVEEKENHKPKKAKTRSNLEDLQVETLRNINNAFQQDAATENRLSDLEGQVKELEKGQNEIISMLKDIQNVVKPKQATTESV